MRNKQSQSQVNKVALFKVHNKGSKPHADNVKLFKVLNKQGKPYVNKVTLHKPCVDNINFGQITIEFTITTQKKYIYIYIGKKST